MKSAEAFLSLLAGRGGSMATVPLNQIDYEAAMEAVALGLCEMVNLGGSDQLVRLTAAGKTAAGMAPDEQARFHLQLR